MSVTIEAYVPEFQIGEIIPEIQLQPASKQIGGRFAYLTQEGMATAAVIELRHIRTAAIDDPERVVQVGRGLLGKGGYGSAGDECATPHFFNADMPDWTIMDQIAVAALITGDDALAKVASTDSISYKRIA